MKSNEPFRLRLVLRHRCRDAKAGPARRSGRSGSDVSCGDRAADRRRLQGEGLAQAPLLRLARRPGEVELAAVGSFDEVTIETPVRSRPPCRPGMVDYGSMTAPPAYHCGACDARDVKLWRSRRAAKPTLLCASCACAEQGCGPATELPDGRVAAGKYGGAEIGWRVPAILMPDGNGYYEYDNAPPGAKDWWLLLPLVLDPADADLPSEIGDPIAVTIK
jgi:hypothetical protein